ncbi:MAG: hypothetical protein JWP69_1584 [Flaviaesturariibacter sp.]|nr:hypothetical protein [Flaviaesturariibacter sp.]
MLTEPRQFSIKKDASKELRNKAIIPNLLLVLSCVIGWIAVVLYASNGDYKPETLWTSSAIIFIGLSISQYRNIMRQIEAIENFTITIETNSIYRDIANFPTVQLYHSEIVAIERSKNSDLVLRSNDKENTIYIPNQMENFEELKMLLSQIRPIEESTKKNNLVLKAILSSVCMIVLTAAVFLVSDTLLLSITWILLLAYVIYYISSTKKSKHIDNTTKNNSWILVLVLALATIKVLYSWL